MKVDSRHSPEVVAKVRALARRHNVSEPEMWRMVVLRGLMNEESAPLRLLAHIYAIVRNLVEGHQPGPELLKRCKEDAKAVLGHVVRADREL